jgi:exopolysaccharide biosynthesis polyprenyl glycosylphosphotransferase
MEDDRQQIARAGFGPGLAVKAAGDRLVAFLALALLSPLLAIIAILIKATSRGPVLFRQMRAGLRGRPFSIYKFRTMVVGGERMGAGVHVVRDDPRITRVGRTLRQLGLDELPQFINVLKGEMSLVGPRPTLPYQVERYTPRQRGRLEMRPGIAGWAQIHGRKSLTWPERIEYDLWYIQHWSVWLDIKILWRTAGVVLTREGADDAGVVDSISQVELEGGGER